MIESRVVVGICFLVFGALIGFRPYNCSTAANSSAIVTAAESKYCFALCSLDENAILDKFWIQAIIVKDFKEAISQLYHEICF